MKEFRGRKKLKLSVGEGRGKLRLSFRGKKKSPEQLQQQKLILSPVHPSVAQWSRGTAQKWGTQPRPSSFPSAEGVARATAILTAEDSECVINRWLFEGDADLGWGGRNCGKKHLALCPMVPISVYRTAAS